MQIKHLFYFQSKNNGIYCLKQGNSQQKCIKSDVHEVNIIEKKAIRQLPLKAFKQIDSYRKSNYIDFLSIEIIAEIPKSQNFHSFMVVCFQNLIKYPYINQIKFQAGRKTVSHGVMLVKAVSEKNSSCYPRIF
uniref:Uncharacterized protein n=1 Tax=Megaselia scalaris TaxID=36166 RepID=T1GWZ2_MEGSC